MLVPIDLQFALPASRFSRQTPPTCKEWMCQMYKLRWPWLIPLALVLLGCGGGGGGQGESSSPAPAPVLAPNSIVGHALTFWHNNGLLNSQPSGFCADDTCHIPIVSPYASLNGKPRYNYIKTSNDTASFNYTYSNTVTVGIHSTTSTVNVSMILHFKSESIGTFDCTWVVSGSGTSNGTTYITDKFYFD